VAGHHQRAIPAEERHKQFFGDARGDSSPERHRGGPNRGLINVMGTSGAPKECELQAFRRCHAAGWLSDTYRDPPVNRLKRDASSETTTATKASGGWSVSTRHPSGRAAQAVLRQRMGVIRLLNVIGSGPIEVPSP
jgi:hypothetical protein